MSEWWTYTLSDFLMFSPQVYYRLFELNNRALWPAHLLTGGFGVAVLHRLFRRPDGWDRPIWTILGALWIWLAWAFFWERYATINWAAGYVAPFIAAEGLLLIAIGVLAQPSRYGSVRQPGVQAAVGLFAGALVLYPLLAAVLGRPWLAAEIFGIAPDPTSVATLALLALAEGRIRGLAMIIPALWCAISAATLWTMGAPDFFIPVAGALAAVVIALAGNRRRTQI
jgi:hypothetical protein